LTLLVTGPLPPLQIWRAEEGEATLLQLVAVVAGDTDFWLLVVGAAKDPLVVEDSNNGTPTLMDVLNAKSAAKLGTQQIGAGTGLMNNMFPNRNKSLLQPPPTT
jgi:hypothetical protein